MQRLLPITFALLVAHTAPVAADNTTNKRVTPNDPQASAPPNITAASHSPCTTNAPSDATSPLATGLAAGVSLISTPRDSSNSAPSAGATTTPSQTVIVSRIVTLKATAQPQPATVPQEVPSSEDSPTAPSSESADSSDTASTSTDPNAVKESDLTALAATVGLDENTTPDRDKWTAASLTAAEKLAARICDCEQRNWLNLFIKTGNEALANSPDYDDSVNLLIQMGRSDVELPSNVAAVNAADGK